MRQLLYIFRVDQPYIESGPLLETYKRQILNIFRAYQPDMGPVHCKIILTG